MILVQYYIDPRWHGFEGRGLRKTTTPPRMGVIVSAFECHIYKNSKRFENARRFENFIRFLPSTVVCSTLSVSDIMTVIKAISANNFK
jgi:hypothetical protein